MPSLHVRQASLSHHPGFLITTCAASSRCHSLKKPFLFAFHIIIYLDSTYYPTPDDVPGVPHRTDYLQNRLRFTITLEAAGPPTYRQGISLPAFRSDSREISSRLPGRLASPTWGLLCMGLCITSSMCLVQQPISVDGCFARDTGSGFRAAPGCAVWPEDVPRRET